MTIYFPAIVNSVTANTRYTEMLISARQCDGLVCQALAAEVGNLSPIFGIHVVEGKNRLLQIVFSPPHGLCGMYMCRFPQ